MDIIWERLPDLLLILQNNGNLALYSSNKAWYNPSGVQAALETYGKCSSGKNL